VTESGPLKDTPVVVPAETKPLKEPVTCPLAIVRVPEAPVVFPAGGPTTTNPLPNDAWRSLEVKVIVVEVAVTAKSPEMD